MGFKPTSVKWERIERTAHVAGKQNKWLQTGNLGWEAINVVDGRERVRSHARVNTQRCAPHASLVTCPARRGRRCRCK